jgi:hypothetical protein
VIPLFAGIKHKPRLSDAIPSGPCEMPDGGKRMRDHHEIASVAFVEGCIGKAQEELNRGLNCSGLLGLESDDWAELYLQLGKAIAALQRAKTRVLGVRTRRLEDNPSKKGVNS